MLVEWWTKINTGKYILTANFFSIKNKERFYILGKDNLTHSFTSGFSQAAWHARQQWSSVLIVLFILIIFLIFPWLSTSQFIYIPSSINGHLDCFLFWALINNEMAILKISVPNTTLFHYHRFISLYVSMHVYSIYLVIESRSLAYFLLGKLGFFSVIVLIYILASSVEISRLDTVKFF